MLGVCHVVDSVEQTLRSRALSTHISACCYGLGSLASQARFRHHKTRESLAMAAEIWSTWPTGFQVCELFHLSEFLEHQRVLSPSLTLLCFYICRSALALDSTYMQGLFLCTSSSSQQDIAQLAQAAHLALSFQDGTGKGLFHTLSHQHVVNPAMLSKTSILMLCRQLGLCDASC